MINILSYILHLANCVEITRNINLLPVLEDNIN